jgi:signal transduction histidine kinase
MHIETTPKGVIAVLLIEAESVASVQRQRTLRNAGYRCIAAKTDVEALACVVSDNPDVVILDMDLASKAEVNLISKMRERIVQKWLPVIALLSGPGDTECIDALSKGACCCVVEPAHPDLLLATVRSRLSALAFQTQAAQEVRLRDEFLATVSHELRTPITSVVGAMTLLVSGSLGELPPAAIELARIAKRNGDRLTRLIDDVLDLAKLESDRMVFNPQLCDLQPLLAASVEAIAYYGRRLDVSVVLEECLQAAQSWVDSDRFMQVMTNLLSNAIKHSPRDKVVSLRLLDAPDEWRIEVQDQGQGIDPAFKSHLFKRFSQAQGPERRHAGSTGLGLYISRMLVQRMGGSIDATSVPGQGSVFSVTLPKGVSNA